MIFAFDPLSEETSRVLSTRTREKALNVERYSVKTFADQSGYEVRGHSYTLPSNKFFPNGSVIIAKFSK